MDTTYSKAVALAVPVFLALIFLELIIDRWKGTRYYHLADAINSLSCGIVSTGMRVFFGFLGLFFYEWILKHWAVVQLPASHWGTWIYAFVLYDLCYYWNHRMGHVSGLFWASHVVHHQSEEFNLTTALRQTGTGNFTGWIFYLPLALTGVPIPVFLIVGVVQLFYQFWPHTQVIGKMGVFDRWIQTPSNHRVHHAQNDIYLDKNYVGVFMIWDHLFGTYQDELDEEPCIYGIRGQLRSWNPVWANLHYYWAMAKDSWHAASWWDKLKVWFAHPGWRPADVAARFPKPEYNPHRDFVKYDPPRNTALSLYALVQFTVIIAVNSHFLKVLATQGTLLNLAYFLVISVSLITIGGVLENRREWLIAEATRLGATALGVLAAGGWFGGIRDARIAYGVAIFAAVSLVWLSWAGLADARAKTMRQAA
jgi:sterol desaturase/sphingolipid hydroxylase (fatty acid hydroxylase superfamily)